MAQKGLPGTCSQDDSEVGNANKGGGQVTKVQLGAVSLQPVRAKSNQPTRTNRIAVYDELRRRIVGLDLRPGTALSENELAAELGVSRTPVREALIMLVQDGLVQVFPKVGTFVSRVDPQRVADAQFLREAVELASLDDIPVEPDATVVAELRENLALQALTEGDLDQWFRLDEQFHQGLLRLAHHEGTWPSVVAAKAHLDRARMLGLHERPIHDFTVQHAKVLDALLEGGPAKTKPLMRAHLRAVFDDIERLRERSPELFAPTVGLPTRRNIAVWE
jgi:DNA-binding GntR family transcriptional regulator